MSDLVNFLYSRCRPRLRDIPADGVVFRQGDPAYAIMLVKEGMVRLVRYSDCGESLTLFRAMPGQTFAEAALFSDIYHCTAVADMRSCVALFPKKELLNGLKKKPEAMLNLISLLSRQVRELRTLLEIRSIRSAQARVLHYLNLYADGRSGAYAMPGTMKELALELGLAHETFYRVLASLEKKGKIKRTGRDILICPQPLQGNRI